MSPGGAASGTARAAGIARTRRDPAARIARLDRPSAGAGRTALVDCPAWF